jgi:hypothetical protein
MEAMEIRLVPSILNLHAGGDLQTAIDNAQPGDTIVLAAGANFSGPITLPNKVGNQWITIESSALSSLPAPGQRVGPQDAAFMPQITAPPFAPALQTAPGAHNYRFVGIEFLPETAATQGYDLIDLGDGSSAQTSLAQVPHDLTLDQCYVHTWLDQSFKRGIALNSASTTIVNSYIAGFKVNGQDSQAIGGWNGPGPYKIDNNYLQAAGENIIFGGATASIPNLIPSDIEIENNEVTKPLTWDPNAPQYAGQHWTVKNLLELKNAQRVTISGNDFENNWLDAQVGFAILFTPRSDPWSAVQNVTFTNNIMAHSAQGINILGSDDTHPSAQVENLLIQNNLISDLGTSLWGPGDGRAFQLLAGLTGGSINVVIDHNTVTSDHTLVIADPTQTGFVFTNNIADNGFYGMLVGGLGIGPAALQKAFPNANIRDNVIVSGNPQNYPANNFFPSSWQDVGFVNLAGGNLQLAANSPYSGKGTNSTSPGVNMVTLQQAQTGTIVRTPSISSLAVTGLPPTVTAGSAVTFTVTAIDASSNAMANYRGTVHFNSSDSQAILPANYTFTAADNGVHTFTATPKSAGTWSLTVADTTISSITGSQGGITVIAAPVTPAPASRLVITGLPSSVKVGISATFTVTAVDPSGKTATGYLGTVHFTSSDSQAVLPGNYTFAATDNGVHTFSVTFKTAGTPSLTITDTARASITGSQVGIPVVAVPVTPTPVTPVPVTPVPVTPTPVTPVPVTPVPVTPPPVTPPSVSRLVVASLRASVPAGTGVNFTVTAVDATGKTVTGYRGTVHFSSTDSQAILPGNFTFTAADNGVYMFVAIPKTAGTQSLRVTDTGTGSITGSQTITVTPAPVNRLLLAGLPSPATAGTPTTFTVTAIDAFGKTVIGYVGTIHFSSSDSQAILPANYTFTAADNGKHTFGITLKAVGIQSLTVADTATATVMGMQAISVHAAPVPLPPPVPPPLPTPPGSNLPNITYHGGPLLQNVQIQSVFFGQPWTTDSNLEQLIPQVDGFLKYFPTSPYMNVLKQYNVGNGSFLNDVVLSQNPPSGLTIDDSQIRQILNSEISAKQLATPTSNQLYVFVTAPGVTVTVNGQSSDRNFAGYHDTFTDSAGTPVYYVLLPYPTGKISTQPLTALQQTTIVLSHEIVEAMTDPDVHSGWFDGQTREEIGDLAEGHFGVLGGYEIQGIWSQAQQQVVVPTDPIGTPPVSASRLVIAGLPSSVMAGTATTFTVTAVDVTGKTVSGYGGTVHFRSSDGQAGLPSDYAFTAGDNGVHTFTVTFKTAGTQSLTVADTTTNSIAGSQAGILVNAVPVTPAPVSRLVVASLPASATAGNTVTLTVTAVDASGKTVTGYSGTVHFSSSDGQAVLPANYTFTAADNGKHTFSVTFKTAGRQSVTATDTATASITGSQGGIAVAPTDPVTTTLGAVGRWVLATAGQAFTGNVAWFTSSDSTAAANSFTAIINWGDGTFSAGTISADAVRGFDVAGTHTYSNTGNPRTALTLGASGIDFFLITATIQDTSAHATAVAWSLGIVVPASPVSPVQSPMPLASRGPQFMGLPTTVSGVTSNPDTTTHTVAGTSTTIAGSHTPTSHVTVTGLPSSSTPAVTGSTVAAPHVHQRVTPQGHSSHHHGTRSGHSHRKIGPAGAPAPAVGIAPVQELQDSESAFWLDQK